MVISLRAASSSSDISSGRARLYHSDVGFEQLMVPPEQGLTTG
jgi:hypothetical protein